VREVPRRFFRLTPANLGDVIAEVTLFYRWGPNDAIGLPWSRFKYWLDQARRISAERRKGS
jgi:hypothetical protein